MANAARARQVFDACAAIILSMATPGRSRVCPSGRDRIKRAYNLLRRSSSAHGGSNRPRTGDAQARRYRAVPHCLPPRRTAQAAAYAGTHLVVLPSPPIDRAMGTAHRCHRLIKAHTPGTTLPKLPANATGSTWRSALRRAPLDDVLIPARHLYHHTAPLSRAAVFSSQMPQGGPQAVDASPWAGQRGRAHPMAGARGSGAARADGGISRICRHARGMTGKLIERCTR